MSILASKSNRIVEKDYTEQLIFSNKTPDASKNKFYYMVIVVLFVMLVSNIVNAATQYPVFQNLMGN
ncbi:MAG: hypothetical protein R3240_10280 [Gammaproteobacteria bacterium]|nr:hypothetical protein [Gammaproteobacteria bacterium]